MSAVTTLAGAAASGVGRMLAIVLAGALLIMASGAGMAWWLAADDLDQARAALVVEQGVSAGLRASIAEQNLAVDGMARPQRLPLAGSTLPHRRSWPACAPRPATRRCRPCGVCWRMCDENR